MRTSGAALGLIAFLAASCGEARAPTGAVNAGSTSSTAAGTRGETVRPARSDADVAPAAVAADPAANCIDVVRSSRPQSAADKEQAARELGKLGPSALPRIVALLDDRETEHWGLLALEAMGADALPALPCVVERLGSQVHRDVANRIVTAFGPAAIPCLVGALKRESPRVRAAAIYLLSAMRAEPDVVLPALVKSLRDDATGWTAEVAFGEWGAAAAPAVPALTALLSESDESVRHRAAYSLRGIGPAAAQAVPSLQVAARDAASPDVAESAVVALAAIAPESLRSLLHADAQTSRLAAVVAMKDMGRRAAPFAADLVACLDDADPSVRAAAIDVLCGVGVPAAAVDKLRANLTNPDANVRAAASRAIGLTAPPSADVARDLAAATRDDDPDVRERAVESLRRATSAPTIALPALVRALNDPSRPVASQAAYAIGAFGKAAQDVVPDLRRHLDSDDPWMQLGAASSLAAIDPPAADAVAAATRWLRDDYAGVRAAAVEVLGIARSRESIPALVGRLDDSDADVRIAAANALARFGADAASAAEALETRLRTATDDGDDVEAAALKAALAKVRPAVAR